MTTKSSIAAFLQLAAASVYLLLGAVSSQNLDTLGAILFQVEGYYGGPWGNPYHEFLSFFSAVIMPLLIGAIGLILFYPLRMEIKNLWKWSQLLNVVGIVLMILIFFPVLAIESLQFLRSEPFVDIGFVLVLYFLILPAVILSLAVAKLSYEMLAGQSRSLPVDSVFGK
ncbi:MAG: hypothetical protein JSW61_03025 [Candidatus Thorarchaeota archaeon]|nr:MAG: hypothetical protein JSW61_03025 [Candidatus Thorarchaeota archaeon]